MDEIIGRRIQQARYRKGANQAQLADFLKVDRATVSRIESGKRPITATELVLVAEFLGAPVASLLETSSVNLTARPQRLLFRGPLRPDDAPQLQWFQEVARLMGVETGAAFSLPSRALRLPPSQAGEVAASLLRSHWDLYTEPLSEFSGRALALGLPVVAGRLPSNSRMAGCLLMGEERGAAIFVNTNHPIQRQRFSLAHEIAHWLFDRTLQWHACDAGITRPGPRSSTEYRADVFASALLFPRQVVDDKWRGGSLTVERFLELHADYGLSRAALVRRLRGLGVLTATQASALRSLATQTDVGVGVPPFRLVGTTIGERVLAAGGSTLLEDCTVLADEEVIP